MEKIYTIPVNEAFEECAADHSLGCPVCLLHSRLENNELELILGASMMEPDVRKKTNEQGFCSEHYRMMLARGNRLGMALILESHLDVVRDFTERRDVKKASRLNQSCYVCGRIDFSLGKMIENTVWLWDNDPEFTPKIRGQSYFCLPHFTRLLESGRDCLNRKKAESFASEFASVTLAYFDELRSDVSWFCRKFDYRYENEPWGNSKDSIERAIKFLQGDILR